MEATINFGRSLLFASLFILGLSQEKVHAQQLGFTGSNYAGTNSLYTNPSAIADSRHAFYLSLFNADFGVTNNYLRYEGPPSLFKLYKEGGNLKKKYTKETINGMPKLATIGGELRGPSFMLRLSPLHSIAFTSRLRGAFNINNLSEDIARLYHSEAGSQEDFLNKELNNNRLNLNTNIYSELGFSYARIILDKKEHFLKGGFTIKKLAGAASAHINMEDFDMKVVEKAAADPSDRDYVLHLNSIRMKYGYSSKNVMEVMEEPDLLQLLIGRDSPGKGWGADFGFVYEFRPKYEKYTSVTDGKGHVNHGKNKYKLRLGIALMDMGGINYHNSADVKGYNLEKNNKQIRLSDFDEAESADEYAEGLNEALDIEDDDKITAFRSGLPTAFHFNIDYKIAGPLYTNVSWIKDLREINAISMRQNSLLAFTPRLEFRKFEVSVPLALQNNYSVRTVGAMVRLGSLYIGSDNVGGLFNIGSPYGAHAYAGFAPLSILKRHKVKK